MECCRVVCINSAMFVPKVATDPVQFCHVHVHDMLAVFPYEEVYILHADSLLSQGITGNYC